MGLGRTQGFHLRLSNRPDVLARVDRSDANMPNYQGWEVHKWAAEVEFEAATYKLLRSEPDVLASRLLYHRIPVQHVGPRLNLPLDLSGRPLFFFERAEGEKNVFNDLGLEEKVYSHLSQLLRSIIITLSNLPIQGFLLAQSASVRASLFNFTPPLDFATTWFLKRLFEQKPESLPVPVAPTRDFCVALFTSKIEATIRNIGDMIGWESDNVTVGPIAVAAKQSLLRLIPHIMPKDSDENSLYRLVLEHGDFGIHNMSITTDANGKPLLTSLFDWETGCITPAILSDPLMAVAVDLVADENAAHSITRLPDDVTPDNRAEYMTWAKHYFEVCPLLEDYSSRYMSREMTKILRRLSMITHPITNV